MHIQCPTCSKVNPDNAAYCFYDGRALIQAGLKGPLKLGTRPFPLPFTFPDGQGCANYNQLVLACDQRWGEARSYLLNGTWEAFFSSLGRPDLAGLALHAAGRSRTPTSDSANFWKDSRPTKRPLRPAAS